MSEKKIGLIGLDTSHVTAFTKLLNDPQEKHHIPNVGKVTCAFPGGSDDLEVSYGRVGRFTNELKENYGIEILDSPEAVAQNCDILMITAVDGRVHRELFERTVKFGRPTFIDKPFACSLEDAEAIVKLANESAVPVMSCSSLRYAENFNAMLNERPKSDILGCDAVGPMDYKPPIKGLYWYGCHTVEMLVAAMGVGCESVEVFENDNNTQITMIWKDGRIANLRGLREAHSNFGFTFHYKDAIKFVNASDVETPYYAGLLKAIFRSLPEGNSDVPVEEMIEVIRIIDATNTARHTGQKIIL